MGSPFSKHIRIWVISLLLLGALLPMAHYVFLVDSAPSVSQQEARELLYGTETDAVLVDIRKPEEFTQRHIENAVNWPFDLIEKHSAGQPLPASMREKQLLLLCDSGILAAVAAQRLQREFNIPAYNVAGGIGAWIGAMAEQSAEDMRFITPSGTGAAVYRETPAWLQFIQFLAGFVIKPAYMILAAGLFLLLRGEKATDLMALKLAMGCFFVGEAFCAFNYLLFGHQSHLSEFFHSYGMIACLGFTAYALFIGVDQRITHAADKDEKCFAVGLCRRCIKHGGRSCGLRNFFLIVVLLALGVAAIPLTTELRMASYNTHIYGTLYNYRHPVIYQIFEQKYCAAYAMVLLIVALGSLLAAAKDHRLALGKFWFAAAMGPLCFSFLRTFLFHTYDDNLVWMEFWEEATELLFVIAAGLVLWFFRGAFFRPGVEPDPY